MFAPSLLLLLISGIKHSVYLPVCPPMIQPLPAVEDGRDGVGHVGQLHALQEPAVVEAAAVVLHFDPQQLPEVQHLQDEAVRLAPLEQVAELLPQLTPARVAVDAVDGDEHVGVGAGAFHVPGDDDDLVLDGDQFAHFAGEALDRFVALKGQELVLFGCQRDLGITVKEIPKIGNDKLVNMTFLLIR